jgi:hypothetical protein
MSKYRVLFPIALTSIFSTYQVFESYRIASSAKKFSTAAHNLGFKTKEEQHALLQILHLAGYLKPEQVWQDLKHMGFKDLDTKFQPIYTALIRSGSDKGEPDKFDPEVLRKAFFRNSDFITSDIMDFLLYSAQHAFNRKIGQERNELTTNALISKYSKEYISYAKKLGLIDRRSTTQDAYDSAWLAGASRIGVLTRAIDLKYVLKTKNIHIKSGIYILAGARELWAEIDGIEPETYNNLIFSLNNSLDIDDCIAFHSMENIATKTQEGSNYMINLARKHHINLVEDTPLITYDTNTLPPGRMNGRTYANYAHKDSQKLTESLMAQDIQTSIFQDIPAQIVDTDSKSGARPTTATTSRDAAEKFIQKILSGYFGDQKHFFILFQTNNPYIERQTLATQREINNALAERGLDKKGYVITLDGIGFACKLDMLLVHSELAALVAEKWKSAEQNSNHESKITALLYQTRDQSSDIEPMPDYSVSLLSQIKEQLTDWFDD